MDVGQIQSRETTIPGLAWARRVLRRQLDVLGRLASVAANLFTLPDIDLEAEAYPSRKNAFAVERALSAFRRSQWALRLIDALRARLLGDLQRVDAGEIPDLMLNPPPPIEAVPEPSKRPETDKAAKTEKAERPDRDNFGRFLNQAFGKPGEFDEILQRPTDEILALIAKELGLPEDWLQKAEDEWESAVPAPLSSPAQRGRWHEAQPQDGGGRTPAPAQTTRPKARLSPPQPPSAPRGRSQCVLRHGR